MRGDESAQAEPREHWQRHRPGNNRIQLPKESIANLEQSEADRVGKRRPRSSPLAPKKFNKQRKRTTSSVLFVRRATQSYDELLAAVPIRPRPCMMLGMINTPDILSIGEKRMCVQLVCGRRPSASAADNSSPTFAILGRASEVSGLRNIEPIELPLSVRKTARVCDCRDKTCADVRTETEDKPCMAKANRIVRANHGLKKTMGRPMPGSRASCSKKPVKDRRCGDDNPAILQGNAEVAQQSRVLA